jgi:hypothetical protein
LKAGLLLNRLNRPNTGSTWPPSARSAAAIW